MRVLISGFEAFDGLKVNPSEQVVELLIKHNFDFELKGIVLPVSFNKAFPLLKKQIDLFKPNYVVGIGLAGIRDEITIERLGINLIEARIPDNEGNQPMDEKVITNGPDALFAGLPIKSMLKACKTAGVRCSISNTAGTYICNQLMYKIIYYGKDHNYKGGFIHIPPTPEIKPEGGNMELSQINLGICKMLNVLTNDQGDVSINTGVEC